MLLSVIEKMTHGKLLHGDIEIANISTDTRTIQPGDAFLALVGDKFDGHDYIQQAINGGAVAVIVSKNTTGELPTLFVEDTLIAYGKIAQYHRQQYAVPVVALTGSCGKTTTKAMITAILQQKGQVMATAGTLNNAIGVPKTLLRLTASDAFAVIELGTNHPGEIDYITRLTEPDVALITNAGPSHLEFLGDIAGVAREKGSIFNGLKINGVAILNRDDDCYSYWQGLLDNKQVWSFGLHQAADVRAQDVLLTNGRASFKLVYKQEHIDIHLPVLGQHNVLNALAASSVALALGLPMSMIKRGLEQVQPEAKRLVEKIGKNGAMIIDDSYNANPASVAAAINILVGKPGEKILVLGQMNELGKNEATLHKEIGAMAKQAGVDELHSFGELTKHAVDGFGTKAFYYTDKDQLAAALMPKLSKDVVILVKGSRGMAMEQIVEALL